MRFASVALGAASLCAALLATAAQAAVTEGQVPPKTTADLIALCSAAKDDPMMTAAVNYCHGFVEGAVQVALSYEAVTRQSREPFCLPSPPPSHTDALAQFTSWANADPQRLTEPAVVGLLSFLTQQYPCPHPAVATHKKK
jgi:Rap1a immunity proteins